MGAGKPMTVVTTPGTQYARGDHLSMTDLEQPCCAACYRPGERPYCRACRESGAAARHAANRLREAPR